MEAEGDDVRKSHGSSNASATDLRATISRTRTTSSYNPEELRKPPSLSHKVSSFFRRANKEQNSTASSGKATPRLEQGDSSSTKTTTVSSISEMDRDWQIKNLDSIRALVKEKLAKQRTLAIEHLDALNRGEIYDAETNAYHMPSEEQAVGQQEEAGEDYEDPVVNITRRKSKEEKSLQDPEQKTSHAEAAEKVPRMSPQFRLDAMRKFNELRGIPRTTENEAEINSSSISSKPELRAPYQCPEGEDGVHHSYANSEPSGSKQWDIEDNNDPVGKPGQGNDSSTSAASHSRLGWEASELITQTVADEKKLTRQKSLDALESRIKQYGKFATYMQVEKTLRGDLLENLTLGKTKTKRGVGETAKGHEKLVPVQEEQCVETDGDRFRSKLPTELPAPSTNLNRPQGSSPPVMDREALEKTMLERRGLPKLSVAVSTTSKRSVVTCNESLLRPALPTNVPLPGTNSFEPLTPSASSIAATRSSQTQPPPVDERARLKIQLDRHLQNVHPLFRADAKLIMEGHVSEIFPLPKREGDPLMEGARRLVQKDLDLLVKQYRDWVLWRNGQILSLESFKMVVLDELLSCYGKWYTEPWFEQSGLGSCADEETKGARKKGSSIDDDKKRKRKSKDDDKKPASNGEQNRKRSSTKTSGDRSNDPSSKFEQLIRDVTEETAAVAYAEGLRSKILGTAGKGTALFGHEKITKLQTNPIALAELEGKQTKVQSQVESHSPHHWFSNEEAPCIEYLRSYFRHVLYEARLREAHRKGEDVPTYLKGVTEGASEHYVPSKNFEKTAGEIEDKRVERSLTNLML